MHEPKQTITGDISAQRTGRLDRGSVVHGGVLWRCGGWRAVHVLPGVAVLAFLLPTSNFHSLSVPTDVGEPESGSRLKLTDFGRVWSEDGIISWSAHRLLHLSKSLPALQCTSH